MLAPALHHVTRALAAFIDARTGAGEAAVLAPLAAAASPTDALVVSLVRVEPDRAPSFTPTRASETGLRTETAVALSATVLIAAAHADYAAALAALDQAVGFFRHTSVFDAAEIPGLKRLTVEVEALSLEDLHHLWATVGAPLRPAVVVRVRVLGSEARPPEPIPTVAAVGIADPPVSPAAG